MSTSILDNSKVVGTSTIKTQLESSLRTKNTGLELTVGNITYRWNGTSFDTVSISSAALVIVTDADGSIVVGTLKSRIMQPVVQASASTANADEFYTDATGVKWWRMKSSVAISSGEAVVAGQSTDVNAAGVKSILDAVTTVTTGTWDAPTGASHSGVLTLTLGETVTPWQKWDGTNRIKTIGMELTVAMAGQNIVLETVE